MFDARRWSLHPMFRLVCGATPCLGPCAGPRGRGWTESLGTAHPHPLLRIPCILWFILPPGSGNHRIHRIRRTGAVTGAGRGKTKLATIGGAFSPFWRSSISAFQSFPTRFRCTGGRDTGSAPAAEGRPTPLAVRAGSADAVGRGSAPGGAAVATLSRLRRLPLHLPCCLSPSRVLARGSEARSRPAGLPDRADRLECGIRLP